MIFKIVHFFARLFTILTMDLHVTGKERIPEKGGCIIAANHLGRLDVVLVYDFLSRKDIILIVAEKYKKYAFVRWLTRGLNATFIDRYNADFSTTRVVLQRLKQGEVFVVSPEGTRSPTGALLEGHQGAAYLASKSGVPVIPVGVTGTEDSLARKQLPRLHRVRVNGRIGEPFIISPLPRENRDAFLKEQTDDLMCRIAALLPPAYRGVYAEHPRLKEFLDK